ncbi:MAG: hypothetical protein Q7R41_00820 [Phycisphaerales bacterium]|nr:hypothetical protein [Phycisphaerales bacterium]
MNFITRIASDFECPGVRIIETAGSKFGTKPDRFRAQIGISAAMAWIIHDVLMRSRRRAWNESIFAPKIAIPCYVGDPGSVHHANNSYNLVCRLALGSAEDEFRRPVGACRFVKGNRRSEMITDLAADDSSSQWFQGRRSDWSKSRPAIQSKKVALINASVLSKVNLSPALLFSRRLGVNGKEESYRVSSIRIKTKRLGLCQTDPGSCRDRARGCWCACLRQ